MYENPFPLSDPDRHAIWEILVRRDFEAFVAKDWSLTGPDFWSESFFGIDAHKSFNPDNWTIAFPTVDAYRDEWLRQCDEFAKRQFVGLSPIDFLYRGNQFDKIEITGDRALAHKRFRSSAPTADGGTLSISFQSMYKMIRRDGNWKIAGFVGYLPYDSNS